MAAKGDAYVGVSLDVADDASVTIQPAAGGEVTIYSVFWSGAGTDIPQIEVKVGDDVIVTESQFPQLLLTKGILPLKELGITLTNTIYITVKNVSGAAMDTVGWTGRYTKATT